MGNQSATRLKGDRYQHLYSWYEILRLLDDDSPYTEAWVEHPEAGAADDLTLHPTAESGLPTRFVQVKFHVDYRDNYTFDTLLRGTAVSKPVLPGLFAAWRGLQEQGAVEVRLVSNWHPAPHPDIGAFIGEGYRLMEEFFSLTKRAHAGKKRAMWRTELQATEKELEGFCRALSLDLSYGDLTRLEEQLDDRMGRHGLKMGRDPRALVADEMFQRIADGGGRKRFTRQEVLQIIEERKLRTMQPDEPEVRLWVHGWAKQGFDRRPTIELDWTERFDREVRRVPQPGDWKRGLLPELRHARDQLAAMAGGKYVDLRGKLPLTASVAVGATLSEVAGFKLRVEQPTGGETHLWRSDAAPTGANLIVRHEEGAPGDDLLLGISVSGNGLDDLLSLRASRGFSAVVYAEPTSGIGSSAVASAGDAVALATAGRSLLREMRSKYRARRVHLVIYSPSSFAVFLGQRLNAVGEVVTYERTAGGEYQESVILATG